MMDRAKQNRLSAEWAAYGDALGFMTELADADRVKFRIGTEMVRDTVPWKRKIGGYNGVSMDLPAGSYSDDTQLRLSTSRAIRADGTFDVAAFAKVELPAWGNYALGAGLGSKEAASNLARTSATWYSNFFDSKRATYVNGGGNGAAMRIQPHVWAARDLANKDAILADVIRNAVCTHGHPRGIVGACLHALTLAFALREGRPAKLTEIRGIIEGMRNIPNVVMNDGDLRLLWLGAWVAAGATSFEEAVARVVAELSEDIDRLEPFDNTVLSVAYPQALQALGAREAISRGSGTKTAVLAAFAASISDSHSIKVALLTITNALGSDTDSIGTMAGAILGACTDHECDGEVQDREYIQSEALRLTTLAQGGKVSSFRYPDLRSWKPARAAVDAIGMLDGHLCLQGLGPLEPIDSSIKQVGSDLVGWCRLSFGQTILARFRTEPVAFSGAKARPEERQSSDAVSRSIAGPPARLRDLFGHTALRSDTDQRIAPVSHKGATINENLQRVITAGFPAQLIGQLLLDQVDAGGKDFVERGIALTANILTAYEARSKRRQN